MGSCKKPYLEEIDPKISCRKQRQRSGSVYLTSGWENTLAFYPQQNLAHIQRGHCCRHGFPPLGRNETCSRLYAISLALPQDSVSTLHSSGVSYLMIVSLASHVLHLIRLLTPPALLVTCARMPLSALQGDVISVIADPMPVQSKAKKLRILVSYGGSVLWLLPVDDCQTWFVSVLAHESDICAGSDNA